MSETQRKPWPIECVQIVAATYEAVYQTVNRAAIRGRVVRRNCHDCQCLLGVDSETIDDAILMKERNGRPLRYICVECCLQYDRCSIDHFVDQRVKSKPQFVITLDDEEFAILSDRNRFLEQELMLPIGTVRLLIQRQGD